jgi:hypothetical protein
MIVDAVLRICLVSAFRHWCRREGDLPFGTSTLLGCPKRGLGFWNVDNVVNHRCRRTRTVLVAFTGPVL